MKTDYFDKAAQQFANLMIEKIQQVEDNWQKPWITIAANTRNFFPQNLTGRRYTGGNAFYSFSFARNSSTRHPYL